MMGSDVSETAESWISDDMRGLVGRTLRRKTSYPVSGSDIRKWAMATYYPELPPAAFLDGNEPLVAPEEFNPFAWRSRKVEPEVQDSPEKLAGIEEPATTVMLNGGMSCRYGVRMREGDVIESSMSVTQYFEKEGKRNRMLFTETEDRWVNQRGETVRIMNLTFIRY